MHIIKCPVCGNTENMPPAQEMFYKAQGGKWVIWHQCLVSDLTVVGSGYKYKKDAVKSWNLWAKRRRT